MDEEALAKQVVDAAYRIHKAVGPGLLESVYESLLAYELEKRCLSFTRQQPVPLAYEGVLIATAFRADLIVEDKLIVEVKSIETIAPVHKKQLLSYLRLSGKRLGLLINFNSALIKDGITRMANNLPEPPWRSSS